jgi:hypothetical protein
VQGTEPYEHKAQQSPDFGRKSSTQRTVWGTGTNPESYRR